MQLNLSVQKGIGLVEILVALLLLAVAVLGFSAMQLTAVKATDESVMRSRALSMMRGGAEMMRANPDGIDAFKKALNGTPVVTDITKSSCVATSATMTSNVNDPTKCTVNQLATRDALVIKDFADSNSMAVRAETCPDTNRGQTLTCLITAWGATNPTIGTNSTDCIDNTGIYIKGSTCFVLEAY